QPSVTLIPGKPRTTNPPAQPPRQPPVPVYIPPNPVLPPTVAATPQTPAQQPIKSRPASDSVFDPNTPWGALIFNNGIEVTLDGERILVGRYDHDLGGVQPEVDLGSMEGADTVSRGHATIEHIGSSY